MSDENAWTCSRRSVNLILSFTPPEGLLAPRALNKMHDAVPALNLGRQIFGPQEHPLKLLGFSAQPRATSIMGWRLIVPYSPASFPASRGFYLPCTVCRDLGYHWDPEPCCIHKLAAVPRHQIVASTTDLTGAKTLRNLAQLPT